jgi:diketogulonate reductase-like aldo/keto reductase
MPMLGLGVWQVPNGPECVNAIRWALEAGYRHIDTAQAYGNENSVGQGLRESGVPREEVFITTKFYPARKDPAAEAERTLRRLGVDYLDLYIVHWPQGGPTRAWPGMERAHELGYARSIGVSNFGATELQQLEAYSPLGHGRHVASQTAAQIAQRLGRTPAQVLLRWCTERGIPLIAKSAHRDRIAGNAQLFDFTLSAQDIADLDALDRTAGTGLALERTWWRG